MSKIGSINGSRKGSGSPEPLHHCSVKPRMDCMDRVHHLVHQWPDLFLLPAVDHSGKVTLARIVNHRLRIWQERVSGIPGRDGFLIFPEQLPADRIKRGQFDARACGWVSLTLTFCDSFPEIILGDHAFSSFSTILCISWRVRSSGASAISSRILSARSFREYPLSPEYRPMRSRFRA